ncbi:MAG TPA: ABC transporter substrate-binding protein, partial [Anaerovoracaceae bacterium]|nr:ABC transporter substrate-binding protein [Anaerovoracaceae bacterium]
MVFFVGCANQGSMTWIQEDAKDDTYEVSEALGDVNANARLFAVYEYIEPTDISPGAVKWVGVNAKKPVDRPLKVGFSQMEVNNDWRVYENNSVFQEARKQGIDLVYRDAESSIKKQNQDILDLIAENVDYLIVAPREYYGLEESFKAAREAKIPIILVDRIAAGEAGKDYVTCIMGDFVEVGKRAAYILADKFPNQKICVFEVMGTKGSSTSSYLSKGFHSVAESLGWEVISVDGNFDRAGSIDPIEDVLISDRDKIDAVFTHIDDSAIAAIQAMHSVGLKPGSDIEAGEIPIVSMGGYKDGLKAIIAGDMMATIECSPRFGPIVFNFIQRLEENERIRSRIVMPGKTYDITNAQTYIETEGY